MVIQPNLLSDAASLQNSQAKNSNRTAAGPDATASQAATPDSVVLQAFDATQASLVAGPEIQDPAAADRSLDFLKNTFLNQPTLAMSAQANQIPASVLQLLQP